MTLRESKSTRSSHYPNENSNLVDSYTFELKKCFNAVLFNKKTNIKKRKNDNYSNRKEKRPKVKRRQNKSIILNIKSKFNPLNPNSNPIEFFYEFQDLLQGKIGQKLNEKEPKRQIPITDRQNSYNLNKNKNNNNLEKKFENRNYNNLNNINNSSNKSSSTKTKEDKFLNRVNYYIDLKNEHINELNSKKNKKILDEEKEKEKENKLNKKFYNSYYVSSTKRKPLYQYHNIDENSLSKNFENFYKNYQKEQKDNKINKFYENKKHKKDLNNSNNNSNILGDEDKFQDFYEKKMRWKKYRDDKINDERNTIEENNEKFINSFSFRPKLNKKSIQIVNKMNNFINFIKNSSCTYRTDKKLKSINKKDIYQKYLLKVRPYVSLIYEKNLPFLKKSASFTKRKESTIEIGMIHTKKGKNIKLIKEKSKDNINNKNNINNNINIIDKKKKNIYKMFKPDKKYSDRKQSKNNKFKNSPNSNNKNISNNNDSKKKIKNKSWWNEIIKKNFNKSNNEDKKIDNLYKVNVRDDCSWSKMCMNQIMLKQIDKNLIRDIIC